MRKDTGLWLIRHAPALGGGRLSGRRDVAADCSDPAAFAVLRARLPEGAHRLRSPALRCVQSAEALWPGPWAEEARLWEQDFGAWEGQAFADLPDLGPLGRADLAAHRPPQGESFLDLCARCAPVFDELGNLGGEVVVLAHAGTIRAALAFALGVTAPALAFDIAPLSLTRIRLFADGNSAVLGVNECGR